MQVVPRGGLPQTPRCSQVAIRGVIAKRGRRADIRAFRATVPEQRSENVVSPRTPSAPYDSITSAGYNSKMYSAAVHSGHVNVRSALHICGPKGEI